ncbi:hypothetical protein QTH27_13725 [Clostridium perfringens]|nr:hypothetical protein [Clostridium perfringens]MDM0486651.1 hypothetical protein [Clostridium perfringens]HBI6976341.1 hypothetical protein [Clostridium perfringens]
MNNIMSNLISGAGGAFIGAIIGAFGSYFGSKKIMMEQFKHEENKIKIENENKKKLLIKVVSRFLTQEIKDNLDVIKSLNLSESIKSKLDDLKKTGIPQQYFCKGDFIKFNRYEEIKWELMKYSDDLLILEIIEIYNDFYIIERGFEIKNMKLNEVERISNTEKRINKILNELI